MDNLHITEFTGEDWEAYKTLRLASLKDSPDSFGSTLDRELNFTEKVWRSRLTPSNNPVHILPLVALSNGKPIGLATGAVHSHQEETAHIYQMWVAKPYRGLGIARDFLSRIEAWANELELTSVSLAVTTSNGEAVRLYQSAGFVPDGNTEPLRETSKLVTQPMMLALTSSQAE